MIRAKYLLIDNFLFKKSCDLKPFILQQHHECDQKNIIFNIIANLSKNLSFTNLTLTHNQNILYYFQMLYK